MPVAQRLTQLRRMCIAAVFTGLVMLSGSTAYAGYPPGPASLTISLAPFDPCGTLIISGTGFFAAEAVTLAYDGGGTFASPTTDNVGSFSLTTPLPLSFADGTVHTVTATGTVSGRTLVAPFTVDRPAFCTPGGGGGGGGGGIVIGGGGIVIGGGNFVPGAAGPHPGAAPGTTAYPIQSRTGQRVDQTEPEWRIAGVLALLAAASAVALNNLGRKTL